MEIKITFSLTKARIISLLAIILGIASVALGYYYYYIASGITGLASTILIIYADNLRLTY